MRLSAILCAALLISPEIMLAQTFPVKPFTASREKSSDGVFGTIYIKNISDDTLIIASVTLQRCDNIIESCDEHLIHKTVLPGERVAVIETTAATRSRSWAYDFAIKTELTATQRARSATITSVGRDGSRVVSSTIPAASFVALIPPITTNSSCGQVDVVGLPAGNQALTMIFGTDDDPVARRVMIQYDASGAAYDFSDTRNATPSDSGSTVIHLDLKRQLFTAWNRRAAIRQPYVLIGPVLDAESLGKPSEMIARVLKECGKR